MLKYHQGPWGISANATFYFDSLRNSFFEKLYIYHFKGLRGSHQRSAILMRGTITAHGVVPMGAGGAMALPGFGRSVNPISTRGGTISPPSTTSPLGFSDLATALIVGK